MPNQSSVNEDICLNHLCFRPSKLQQVAGQALPGSSAPTAAIAGPVVTGACCAKYSGNEQSVSPPSGPLHAEFK